jgi:hypothetical protein
MNLIKKIIEYLKYGKKRDGLIDLHDDRNFGSNVLFKPTAEDIKASQAKTFIVFDPSPIDQLDSDFCVGEGSAYEADATEDFEGASGQGSGAFVFACAKKLSGQLINSYGISLLSGGKARAEYGICKKELYEYKKGMRNWFANFNNIPAEAFKDASKHKLASYWEVSVPWTMSKFDSITAHLWHFKDKKVLIASGNNSHRITIIGYNKERDCLVCRDTYGLRTYDKGIRLIGRTEASTLFTPYFGLDMERGLAEILIQYNEKIIKTADSNKCYVVRNGAKHYVPDEKTAWSNNYLLAPYDGVKLVEIVDKADFDKIPNGDDLKFEGGKNEFIIRRIAEKYKINL